MEIKQRILQIVWDFIVMLLTFGANHRSHE